MSSTPCPGLPFTTATRGAPQPGGELWTAQYFTRPLPTVVDRAEWQAELDRLLVREKAHTREGDANAAARRRLPMTEVDATSYHLLDLTIYGRQETWEDSPQGWPQRFVPDGQMLRTDGRPTAHSSV